jgi:hypothetical protein
MSKNESMLDTTNIVRSDTAHPKEVEAWGVTYERYALGRKLEGLAHKYALQTVAEMPAHGAKAMPSIYSVGFGLAGAAVTLINGINTYGQCWQQLGLDGKVAFLAVDSLYDTGLPDKTFDMVWNFAYLPIDTDRNKLIEEMKRISKRYLAFFSVNYGNIGFHIHRFLHKVLKVTWTHGDVYFNKQQNIVRFITKHGLRIVEKGFVDCPIWPDSVGFRDMRLHRQNISFDGTQWESPYIDNMASGSFPLWIKCVYAWERMPNVSFIKTLYAHINYVIGEKK